MNILFITYQDIHTDGRTNALLDNMEGFGEVRVISPLLSKGKGEVRKGVHFIESNGYMDFVKKAKSYIKTSYKKGDIDCLFIDNRRATTIGLKAYKLLSPKLFIYDARELYLPYEMKDMKSKIGCYFEKKIIEKANIVICANEERKTIMEKEFKTKNSIMVFDNFRKLEYSDMANISEFEEKYKELFADSSFNIISTAGCDISRLTDKLVLAMKNLNFNARLILVGCKDGADKEILKEIIEKNNINKVTFIDRVNLDELKYLISKSQVGVSTYHQKNQNNMYCSSGKIYEYVYEGKPIVTSTNPTLKNVIDKYQFGAYSDDLSQAIEDVYKNYEIFKKNAETIIEDRVVEKKHEMFKEELKERMEDELNVYR